MDEALPQRAGGGRLTVRVSRRYASAAEPVFDAWLDPRKARQFLFATPTGKMVRVDIDARVGGGFTIVENRDGKDAAHDGVYREIARPTRIVFDFSIERDTPGDPVTIEIHPLERGCELTLTHGLKPQYAEFAEKTRAGWASILEGLARTLGEEAKP
jgi:uncharacterized protein YndB with AHSA1/START domain